MTLRVPPSAKEAILPEACAAPLPSIPVPRIQQRGHTWAGGREHRQGLRGVGLSSEPLHKFSLALKETEVPREGGIEHVVHPWKASTHLTHMKGG